MDTIDPGSRQCAGQIPDMTRIVVAVDASGARSAYDELADSIGIIVAGKGIDGRGYVLADRSCKLSPAGWGRRACEAFHEFKADRLIYERNYGGAMVEHVIKTADPSVSCKEVVASRGKVVRAEPISALYEQGRISHVAAFPELEDQMLPDGFRRLHGRRLAGSRRRARLGAQRLDDPRERRV